MGCHRAVFADELEDDYDEATVSEWREHIEHLTAVPSLTGIEHRFRREWLVTFLQEPCDLRPEMEATMPRLRMSAEEAATVAAFFIPEIAPSDEPTLGSAARGRALFVARQCGRCHHFGGSGLATDAGRGGLPARLAPDLRHTRERMTAASVLRWLASPRAVKPDTLMPEPELSLEERQHIAAFLLESPLEPVAATPRLVRLPVRSDPVRWADVNARVFRRICRHCHADPEPMDGEGGPGNTGGFGFEARGIDLSSYEAIRATPELFEPDEQGVPLVVAAMWRRHLEVAGVLSDRRGMPLGLPPMSLEDIQLVESWVAQGGPR